MLDDGRKITTSTKDLGWDMLNRYLQNLIAKMSLLSDFVSIFSFFFFPFFFGGVSSGDGGVQLSRLGCQLAL